MGERKVVDLSRFFLFEAAGDSEADFDHANSASFCMVDEQGNEYKSNVDVDTDVDDAESCSYDVDYGDTSHSRNAQVEILEKGHDHYDDGAHYDEDLDGGMRGDWEDNGGMYCIDEDHHHHHHHHHYDDDMGSSEVTSTANSYASRKCAQSSKRKMSEIEKSRLFWEACLAS